MMRSGIKLVPAALAVFATVVCLVAAGCKSTGNPSAATHALPTTESTAVASEPAPGQPTFDSPDAAVQSLVSAAKAQDRAAALRLFGPEADKLTSGDPVADAKSFKTFASHAAEGVRIEQTAPDAAQVYIGQQEWPLPIPLAKAATGKWYFDTNAGLATILARRIGHNELQTIGVCRAYVEAQRIYASEDRDGDGVLQYARRLKSSPGHHDGLYWPVKPGETESPFGPLAAQAATEGYGPVKGAARTPYHGYLFRVLTSQGPDAPGGKYNYIINGRLLAGFALIAWPDKYGSSGVMTFIVNQYGIVYQKDLGPDTAEVASKITTYNPDSTWTRVP